MFTLTPLSSTILFHFCLSPTAIVSPPHASLALSLSLFPSFSSCPVETPTELSCRSFPAYSSTFTKISFLFWSVPFFPPLSSLFSFSVNSINNFCNCLTAFTSEGGGMLKCPTVDYSSAVITKKKGAVIYQLLEKITIIRDFKKLCYGCKCCIIKAPFRQDEYFRGRWVIKYFLCCNLNHYSGCCLSHYEITRNWYSVGQHHKIFFVKLNLLKINYLEMACKLTFLNTCWYACIVGRGQENIFKMVPCLWLWKR